MSVHKYTHSVSQTLIHNVPTHLHVLLLTHLAYSFSLCIHTYYCQLLASKVCPNFSFVPGFGMDWYIWSGTKYWAQQVLVVLRTSILKKPSSYYFRTLTPFIVNIKKVSWTLIKGVYIKQYPSLVGLYLLISMIFFKCLKDFIPAKIFQF